MKKITTSVFLLLATMSFFTSCKKKEKTEPTAFTIYDVYSPATIGQLDKFGFTVNVAGTQSVKAHITVTDAAGNPLKDVVTDSYSNNTAVPVQVTLGYKTFVGPMIINVTDESGGNAVSASANLNIDKEINKQYTQLTKGVPATGDVSAQDNYYGDFVDVVKIPNAAIGDSVIVDFNHLSDPGKYADVYIYDSKGLNVYTNINVPNRGKAKTKLIGNGDHYVYVVFNNNAGFQEHWYWLTWK